MIRSTNSINGHQFRKAPVEDGPGAQSALDLLPFLKWAGGTRFAVSHGVVLGAGVIEERGSIGPENRCERRGLSWQPKEEGTQSSRPGFFS